MSSDSSFDVRLLNRRLQAGQISQKQYDEYLKSLPDDADKLQVVYLDELEQELYSERAAIPQDQGDEITMSLDNSVVEQALREPAAIVDESDADLY